MKGDNFEGDDKKGRENLIKEIKQYEKFPNDYRHCIFSRHVYMYAGKATDKSDPNNKQSRVIDEAASNHLRENFTKLYDDGWRVDQVQIESGFKSILYINEKRKQLVLAFKGVQLEIRDLFLEGKCSLISLNLFFHEWCFESRLMLEKKVLLYSIRTHFS